LFHHLSLLLFRHLDRVHGAFISTKAAPFAEIVVDQIDLIDHVHGAVGAHLLAYPATLAGLRVDDRPLIPP
jgi:hypothetical protein